VRESHWVRGARWVDTDGMVAFRDENNRVRWWGPSGYWEPPSFIDRLLARFQTTAQTISIDAGDAHRRLEEFHRITGVWICDQYVKNSTSINLSIRCLPDGIKTQAIHNEVDWREALRHMLSGTGYRPVIIQAAPNVSGDWADIEPDRDDSSAEPTDSLPEAMPIPPANDQHSSLPDYPEILVKASKKQHGGLPERHSMDEPPGAIPSGRPPPEREPNCLCGAHIDPQHAADWLHWCMVGGNPAAIRWASDCEGETEGYLTQ
jgi:hypothetical protein